jgi:DNA-binding MarR family transcriptional regulator
MLSSAIILKVARPINTGAVGIARKRGKPPLGSKPNKTVLQRLYVRETKSIREIAELRGCTKDMVARALKEYGIEARTKVRRSELRKHGLQALRAAASRKGVRKTARELGVNPSTLSRFLRSETEK